MPSRITSRLTASIASRERVATADGLAAYTASVITDPNSFLLKGFRLSQPIPATAANLPSRELLLETIRDALESLKAQDIIELDVRGKTSITDCMFVASGTSTRHVSAIAEEVLRRARGINNPPIGVEGEREGEWALVDLGDAIVHIMLPRMRDLYMLERLWGDSRAQYGALALGDAEPVNA